MDAHSSQPKVPIQASVEISQENIAADQKISDSKESKQNLLVLLFNEHYNSLVRLASFLLDDINVCEEIVQDAFVKMQVTKSRPEAGREAAYLRSIVLNGARSKMRRRQVRKRVMALQKPAYTTPLETEVIDSAERRRIVGLLRQLPHRQAEVLTLRFYMDLSEEEIAKTLDISKGSVKTHASRGLDKMGKLLSQNSSAEIPNSSSSKK